jgi:protein-tyrosine phosphatase
VLCHGNICRSPYAEAVLRKRFEDRASLSLVESAGFIYPGRQPPRTALEVAAAKGFDLFNHRSRAVTEEMVRSAAVIIVMEGWQRSTLHSLFPHAGTPVLMLGDLDPAPIERRAIQDPIEQPAHVFERVFARIDACCAELVARATAVERSATA